MGFQFELCACLGSKLVNCYDSSVRKTTITPQLLRAAVYGANDGVVTTFAVVAGVAGASLNPRIIVIMGIANLIADGLAMGLGDYLGEKSEREMEKSRIRGIWHTGLTTFISFVVVGLAPLLPYLVGTKGWSSQQLFAASICSTAAALFLAGSLRSVFTRKSWWSSGIEMLVVGALAAGAAYGLGAAINNQL